MKNKKNIVAIILIFAILLSIYPKVYAVDITLKDITNIFNACTTVQNYNKHTETKNLSASYVDDDANNIHYINVSVYEDGETTVLQYTLNKSTGILTANYTGSNTKERAYWPEVTNILIDCIEQFHGYAEGEMFDTLESSQIANYTLENEGLNIKDTSPSVYLAEINIKKAIPTLDTNTYIKDEDLTGLKGNLSGDGIAKLKKGKVLFYKQTIDDKDILTVGEQEGFSFIINRSIPTILKAILGSDDAVEYFSANYPKVEGNKQFDGFKVEVNPIKNSTEENVFGTDNSYKIVRITIDREAVKTAVEEYNKQKTASSSTENTTTTSATTSTTSTSTTQSANNVNKLPKTGEDDKAKLISTGIIAITAWAILMLLINYEKNKNKKK